MSSGSIPRRAASSRSTAFTCPAGSRVRYAPGASGSPWAAISPASCEAARAAPGAGPNPGSTGPSSRPTARCTGRGTPTAWRPGTTIRWSAAFMAWRWAAAFFGESMFSVERDASKVALVHLVARLKGGRLHPAGYPVRHPTPQPLRRGRDAARPLPFAARRCAPAPRDLLSVRLLRCGVFRCRRRLGTGEHPDVVDRVLERRETRRGREHPPRIEAHRALIVVYLVDL